MRKSAKLLPTSRQESGNTVRLYYGVFKGAVMQKVINCPCGAIVRGDNDEDVVKKAQQHAKDVHQMDLSREQALAMARPE